MTQPNATSQAEAGPDEGRQVQPGEQPPLVAQMPQKSPDTHLEQDPRNGVRVDHLVKPPGPLPPEEASKAGERMTGELEGERAPGQPSPPLQDVRVSTEEPSVWVAGEKPET